MYNVLPILLTYFLFILFIYIALIAGLKERNIRKNILKLLPIAIITDIPINYLLGVEKAAISLRVWNFIAIFIIILYLRESFENLKKGKLYFNLLYVFFIIHLLLTGFSLVVLRGYIKFIFSYIPLILAIKIFIDKFGIKEQIKILRWTAIITMIFSSMQIVMFRFFNKNFFIIPLFQKISGTFSEPIWSGVYLGFIFIILTNSKKDKIMRIFCFIFIALSASEASIIGLIIVYILTSKKIYIKLLFIVSSIISGMYIVRDNLLDIKNLVESFYIHSSNWIVNLIAYSKGNVLQLIFGLGLSNSNFIASQLDMYKISHFLGIDKQFLGITLNKLGGDSANLLIEILTSFGIAGICIFILANVIYLKFLFKYKTDKKYLRIYLYYLIIGMVHPLYYMGLGIFMIMYSICNSRKEALNE